MADERTIRVRLEAEIRTYQEQMRQASAATGEFAKNVSGMGNAVAVDIERVGRSALVMSAGLTAGLGLSAKAAIDWESAWAGVLKTVDGTDEELATLQAGLRRMATELPATHAEIAGVAEAAGQLGIAVGDVESFTRVMIDLGETTNLSAEQAAISLARFTNIMGTSASEVDRIGATVVELGNNFATTEAEIVEFATRLAAAGNIAGLTEADVLAFAATLTSVGVEAEAGGTALSKVFTAVRDAVLTGNESLQIFAETAGMTSEEFRQAFERDAAGAIASFVEGLGRINAAGRSTTEIFQALSLTDQRLMRALLSTASAGDLLAQSLAMGAQAWEENSALADEAAKRYETTAAQVEMFRSEVTDLAITAGQVLLPALNATVGILGDLASGFSTLPGPVITGAVALGSLAAAGTGVIGTVAIMGPKIAQARASLMAMGTAGQFVGTHMGTAAKGLAAFGAATAAISLYNNMMREAEQRAASFGASVRDSLEGAESYDQLVAKIRAVDDGIISLDRSLKGSSAPWDADYRHELRAGISELEALGGKYGDLVERVDALSAATGVTRDEALALIREQERLALSANSSGEQVRGLLEEMDPAQVRALAAELGVTTDQLSQMGGAAVATASQLDVLLAAQRRLADAPMERRAAELSLADAIDAVETAQRVLNGETSTGISQAESAADAAHKLAQAQHRVAEAQRAVAAAEATVAKKREELRKILEGYGAGSEEATTAEERAAKAKRDAERAELALADAERKLRDPRLSGRDRRKAELDLAEAQDRVRDSARAAAKAEQDRVDALHGADPASQKAKDASEALADAELSLESALMRQADALKAVDDASSRRARNMPAGAVRDQAKLERDLERAMLELERRYHDAARGEAERRIALMEANGETVTAQDETRIFREELEKIAGTLDPRSPLRRNLDDYVDALGDLREEVRKNMSVNDPNFMGPLLNRNQPTNHPNFMGPLPRRAMGGPAYAGSSYLVGERGPEVLTMGATSGHVHPFHSGVTQTALGTVAGRGVPGVGTGSGGGPTYDVSIGQVIAGSQPTMTEVLAAMRRDAWETWGVLG